MEAPMDPLKNIIQLKVELATLEALVEEYKANIE